MLYTFAGIYSSGIWYPRRESNFKGRGSEIITTPCFENLSFHIIAFVQAGPPLEKHVISI